ncbi:hypothetical protein [Azotobacter chroococcum]|uniref:hypothetical protein n=1 Tax=Azotobacter chroococcum TaxID=353 RepID=UPI0010AEE4F0|nr:hypothetical protein [Azotobacter chroococcum]TKD33079.1 hypothetical protein FCG41_21205 [Azotobacter chroococcum]
MNGACRAECAMLSDCRHHHAKDDAIAVRALQALRAKRLASLETGLATHRERCAAALQESAWPPPAHPRR